MIPIQNSIKDVSSESQAENRHAVKQLINHGALLQIAGDLQEAKRAYGAALEIDADNATACNNLGFCLAQEGDYARAMEFYERAVQINPHHSMAYANMGPSG